MNRTETLKIMAMLSAFYGEGKSDPEEMANAWYLILKDYDYDLTEKAVLEFARNDQRDYANFPPPGKLISEIEKQLGKYNLIVNSAFNKTPYRELPLDCQELVNHEKYKELLLMDSEEVRENRIALIQEIRKQQKLLG